MGRFFLSLSLSLNFIMNRPIKSVEYIIISLFCNLTDIFRTRPFLGETKV